MKQPNKEVATRKKVLLVEDSEVIRSMVRSILEFCRHEVTSAKNGEEALELFKKNDYDVIFMDLAMPIMGGLECLQTIREMSDKKKANVPVVAVTGNDQFYTREELIKNAKFSEFIEKPIDFDKVSKVLRKIDEEQAK